MITNNKVLAMYVQTTERYRCGCIETDQMIELFYTFRIGAGQDAPVEKSNAPALHQGDYEGFS